VVAGARLAHRVLRLLVQCVRANLSDRRNSGADARRQAQKNIGVAYIDQNRCIPWASFRPCVVCEEMCSVLEKTVCLEKIDPITPDSKHVHLQRPRVVSDLCIGCGICEDQCPLAGPAAIRVYVPTKFPALKAG
jgi:ferredoxin